jgi:hypothetical protein
MKAKEALKPLGKKAMTKREQTEIEWLRRGLEHIRDGRHRCTAASLAEQVLCGHVWDSRWMEKTHGPQSDPKRSPVERVYPTE